jgi:hypothetical protein
MGLVEAGVAGLVPGAGMQLWALLSGEPMVPFCSNQLHPPSRSGCRILAG